MACGRLRATIRQGPIRAAPAIVCVCTLILLEVRSSTRHDPKTRAILSLSACTIAVVATGAEYSLVYAPLHAIIGGVIAPISIYLVEPTVANPVVLGHALVLIGGFLPSAIRDLRALVTHLNTATVIRGVKRGYI